MRWRDITICVLLALPACGGGGGSGSLGIPGDGGTQPALAVEDLALPALEVGEALDGFQLRAQTISGAAPHWYVDGGDLPPGITLSIDGVLAGTPTEAGVFAFNVRIVDGTYAHVAGLALAVDAFGIYVQDGLTAGDAIEGRLLRVATVGAEGSVELDVFGTGAWVEQGNAAGRGAFLPGAASEGSTLVLQATDDSGNTASLELDHRADVTAGFRAEWGVTDVWHLDFDVRLGAHAYTSDFHAALAVVGLRSESGLDRMGSAADRLAAECVRVELHRALSELFLREADGSAGSTGLAISFAYDEPGAGYLKPQIGTYMSGGPNRFSVIALCDGTRGGVVGTAFVDDAQNPRHENDTTNGADEEFGVFLNTIAPFFNASWSNHMLRESPVEAGDIAALRAILYREPVAGARAREIERILRGFANAVARVAGHEIGHSLGFEHTEPSVSGSIMNAYASIGPNAAPAFLPSRIDILRAVLPGPGRLPWSAPTSYAKPMVPGGISVCEGRCCDLRIR